MCVCVCSNENQFIQFYWEKKIVCINWKHWPQWTTFSNKKTLNRLKIVYGEWVVCVCVFVSWRKDQLCEKTISGTYHMSNDIRNDFEHLPFSLVCWFVGCGGGSGGGFGFAVFSCWIVDDLEKKGKVHAPQHHWSIPP